MDPSQNMATFKWSFHKIRGPSNGPFTKIRDLKTDPKIKNYNVIFHICSATNEFIRKLLTNLTKLYFFTGEKKK